jgi:hypothetical protein
LLLSDDQRRRYADGVFTRAEEQEPAFKRQFDDAIALVMRGGASLLVLHDLDANHQAAAAHIADHGV